MSVLSCGTFLLILLAILETACSARPGVLFDATAAMAQDEDHPSDHSNMFNKKDGLKINITDHTTQGTSRHQVVVTSTLRKSSLNNDIKVMVTRHRRHKHTSRKKNKYQGGGGTKATTFSVPQKNKEDQHQQHSFTLDYSPPKVHPPHHN